ncbi:MAG: DUF2256 domain-containing protein [Chitinophagaceae bacterium]|nr:DUF2256 domain-containing protein [Chitinophagaceae bacterium]
MKQNKNPGRRAKADLPEKICLICQRPFRWRKKWETIWSDVKYCSDKCRMNRNKKIVNVY